MRATSGTGAREKTADQTITVTVTDEAGEAPGAPATPTVSSASVSSVTVAWAAPSNAGPPITDYDYRYRVKTPRGPWTEVTTTPIPGLSATITGLAENTEYEVQVRATNAEGTGDWSDPPGSGSTDANAAPSFTSSATYDAVENQTAVGTVAASDGDAGDSVTGYAIQGGADQSRFTIVEATGELAFTSAPNFEAAADADTDNDYVVVVRATSGTGAREKTADQTITVTVTDEAGEAPGAPATPTVSSASVSSVTVAWAAPSNAGPPITDYDYRYRVKTPRGPWTEVTTTPIPGLSATITGLAENTEYEVQVRATNAEGTGDWSDPPGSGSTDANAAPSFTSSATYDAVENQTAVGTVAASDGDAGDSVTGYAIQGGADQSQFTIVEATGELAFTSAPNFEAAADADTDNDYVVVVRATSGTGAREKTADQTITVTVTDEAGEAPGAPATPTVSSASVSSVTVAWAAPSNAGPPITDYDYRYRVKTPRGPWTEVTTTPIPGLSATITGLAENTEYEVQVRATNAEGTGDWSDPPGSGSTDANAAPSFTSSATYDAVENQTAVGTVAASDGDAGDSVTGYAIQGGADAARFTIVEATGELAFTSAPNFEAAADADTDNDYVVVVRATSGTGAREKTADQTITVTVTDEAGEAPGAPATPTVSSASVSSVTVAWAAPSNAGPPITDYDYRYRVKTPRGPWTEVTTTPIPGLSATITGLAENTEYEVQVRATNAEGTGDWSDPPGSGSTDANAAPSFTSSATVDAVENQTAVGTVAASDGDAGDSVTGYAIQGGADQSQFTIVEATGELAFTSAPNFEAAADADTDNDYVVVVRATSGMGAREKTADQTITVTVTDEAGEAPGAPATPTVSSASVSSVTVAWAAPSNAGPPITDYDYRYRVKTPRGPWTEVTTTPIPGLSATITGLAENTEYEVQVRATNAEGTGDWSDPPGSGSTDANAAPSFTSSATYDAVENQTAVGTVAASDGDAGDSVTGYAIEGGADQSQFTIVEATGELTFDAAPNFEAAADADTNNDYVVVVRATSGTGAREKTADQTITVTVTDEAGEAPGAPATPTVSSASVSSVTVAWAAPSNAGPPITDYDYRYRVKTPQGPWTEVTTTPIPGLSATITGLAENTEYEVQVRATNAEGTGDWSDPPGSGSTDANAAPSFTSSATYDAVENQTAVGTVMASDGDAGDSVTGYAIEGGADQSQFTIVEATGELTFDAAPNFEAAADADTDNDYVVVVRATSGTGAREKTADQTITVTVTDEAGEAPGAPATPSVSSASVSRVTVTWTAPANAGKPAIASYDVQYRAGTSGTWIDGPEDVTTTTATVTGLVANTLYEARVRATNAEGDSEWSDPPGSGRTNASSTSVPGAPGNLRTTPGDGRVTLAWTAPRSDGGAAIEKYQYRAQRTGTTAWTPAWTDVPDGSDPGSSAADETTFTVSGLINGTEYVFELRAVNSVGEGPAASATDTPVRAPLPPGSGFLVGNFGQPADRVASIFVTQDIVGVFTTGARGAELHNIEFRFFTRLPNITVLPIPSVTLYRASVTDSRATRGARVAALTAVPGTPRSTDTAQTVAFAAPSGARLEAGATYLVVLERAFPVSVESTTFPAEDAGGAPGWAIDGIGAGNNSPYSYRTTASLLMRVNGAAAGATVATAPEAPASLGARAGDAEVTLRWAPPRSDGGAGIEKYQVRYSAGSRVDPETDWTDVRDGSDPGMSLADERSVSVTGLDNGRQYAFELRAVNGVRAGAAATATATPAAPPRSGFLVSNFGQPVDGAAQIYVTKDIVGVFTAGTRGGALDSIEFRLDSRTPEVAQHPSATLYRGSVTGTRATPGTRVATLTAKPGSPRPAASAETITFTAPGGTRLAAGATYMVVLEASSGYVGVQYTNASAQDAGGASGWTIDGVGAGNSSPYSYGTSDSLLMSVNGTTAAAARQAVREKAAKDEQEEQEEPATSPDPDRGISLSTSSSSAIEGQAVTISVRRAGPTDRTTSVAVQVFDSALTGAWPIDLDFRSGVATATATVAIPFDGARPASRTVTVRLASVEEPYSVGSPSTLTFNVTERDAALSVDDASVSEGPGATLAFAVTLDRTRDREVRVKYATSDGTATQGDDYTGVSGTLRFAPGETSKTVSVTVLDDAHDEGSETLTLTLSSPRHAVIDDDTAVGTIVNSDPLPNAWLSRFGRAASDQVVQSIGRRLEGGARESHLTVMGWRMDRLLESTHSERDAREPRPGAARPAFEGAMAQGFPPMQGGTLQSPARAVGGFPANAGGNPASASAMGASDNRWLDLMGRLFMSLGPNGGEALAMPGLRDMVMGSSFYYGHSPDAGPLRGMNRMTAWGESASTRFSGAEGKLSLDGEVNTAILGADGEWGRWLAGLALSYSEGEGGYRQASAKGGAVSSTLTGINPYARYRLDERTSLWATLGYGSGRLTLTADGAEVVLETDMTNAMAAFGGRGVLSMRGGETGQFELAVRTDAMLTDTASMAVAGLSAGEGATSRIRLILEGSGSLPAFGGVLAPKVEAGLRYDGGDAETGAGLEVGGGLAYDKARLTVQVDGRVLLTHRDRDYEEWGYSLSFEYKPASDGRGLRYQAGSQWGATQSGVQSLWSLQNAGGLTNGAQAANGQRYTAELGYGFGERRLWYPYVATESGGASSPALRFGLNLNAGSHLEAGLEIGRLAHLSCQMENDIRLQWQARW